MDKLLMHRCYNIALTDRGIGYFVNISYQNSLCSLFAIKQQLQFFHEIWLQKGGGWGGGGGFFLKVLRGKSNEGRSDFHEFSRRGGGGGGGTMNITLFQCNYLTPICLLFINRHY